MSKRLWGEFKVLSRSKKFLVKKLVIYPKSRTSLQYHEFRNEYWIVLDGKGKAVVNKKKKNIKKGDMIVVKEKQVHRIENPYKKNLIILEIWVGEKLKESDIVRLKDDYGRV